MGLDRRGLVPSSHKRSTFRHTFFNSFDTSIHEYSSNKSLESFIETSLVVAVSLASLLWDKGKQRGPHRGFGNSGRRAIYFQGFGEKGHLFSGIWEKA